MPVSLMRGCAALCIVWHAEMRSYKGGSDPRGGDTGFTSRVSIQLINIYQALTICKVLIQ